MATLNASLAEIFFGTETRFSVAISGDATFYMWETPDGHRITAHGTGFTYSGLFPTGGTVTQIDIDVVDTSHPPGFIDGTITGLSVPLTALLDDVDPAAGEISFWETALGGSDIIIAPESGEATMTGDFTTVVSTVFSGIFRAGGNDRFTAFMPEARQGLQLSRGGPHGLIGDAFFVEGAVNGQIANFASLDGGNDTMRLIGYADYMMTGDVFEVRALGEVSGGNDNLRSDATIVSFFGGTVAIGDVAENGGSVTGGRDNITGTNFAFTLELLIGDVNVQSQGTTTGGADTISGRAGQERIAGDVANQRGGAVTGAADVIWGGEDSDIIAGDVLNAGGTSATTLSLTGGGDRIYGENGNDWIVGDLWSAENVDPASTIVGAADRIFGGNGDDMIFGDADAAIAGLLDVGGNDVIDGGLGDDFIDGQLGIDTASFASEAFAVVADLATGIATGQGSDTLAGIEYLTGSSLNDTLRGNTGANRLTGGDGNDSLVGRQGNDTLIGGNGNDTLNGGSGADAMTGNVGADIFVEGPAAGGPVVTDTITDFQNGADRIDLKAFGFANFAAVQALTTATASGIRIDVPGAEILLVNGLTLAQFDAGDVILV
jgi:Ca2+-binding RTX toxin-like protein